MWVATGYYRGKGQHRGSALYMKCLHTTRESNIDLETELSISTKLLNANKTELETLKFQLSNVKNDTKVLFYIEFASYGLIYAQLTFFGSSDECLHYLKHESKISKKIIRCHSRTQLPLEEFFLKLILPLEEFFLKLICPRLGLIEPDLACRFGISQSTLSRITNT